MRAIGQDRPGCAKSLVFATQSTHKMLASLSQASQILVQEAETTRLDEKVLNEAFLMHTSTSPQYESLTEALEFRRAMIRVAEETADTGLDLAGAFDDTGIPAAVVTRYLAEHGIVVARLTTDMYTSDLVPEMLPPMPGPR